MGSLKEESSVYSVECDVPMVLNSGCAGQQGVSGGTCTAVAVSLVWPDIPLI